MENKDFKWINPDHLGFNKWLGGILWYKDYVVLLDGKRLSKQGYITDKGFNTKGFNQLLRSIYNKEEII